VIESAEMRVEIKIVTCRLKKKKKYLPFYIRLIFNTVRAPLHLHTIYDEKTATTSAAILNRT
jgi:hypothetical protein